MYWVENQITGHKRTGICTAAPRVLLFGWASSERGGRNIKRNVLEKLMEYEEDGPVKDLDLTLPGRDALGLIL